MTSREDGLVVVNWKILILFYTVSSEGSSRVNPTIRTRQLVKFICIVEWIRIYIHHVLWYTRHGKRKFYRPLLEKSLLVTSFKWCYKSKSIEKNLREKWIWFCERKRNKWIQWLKVNSKASCKEFFLK